MTRSAARLRQGVGPLSTHKADAGRSRTDLHGWVSKRGKTGDLHRPCGTVTIVNQSSWMGIEARENRRSPSPVPDRGRVRTNTRRAGCPSASAESRAWASSGHGPSSAMPRPNMACRRRRHRRYTNMYSFVSPWRFIVARSAARLRRGVGPLASRKAVAGQTEQPDIIGNN